jgi:hypothetical protein
MVQANGGLHLVPPLATGAAGAIALLAAPLQESGVVQSQPAVPPRGASLLLLLFPSDVSRQRHKRGSIAALSYTIAVFSAARMRI